STGRSAVRCRWGAPRSVHASVSAPPAARSAEGGSGSLSRADSAACSALGGVFCTPRSSTASASRRGRRSTSPCTACRCARTCSRLTSTTPHSLPHRVRSATHAECDAPAPSTFQRMSHSPYVDLDRGAWAKLGESAPLPLSAAELDGLRSLGDPVDLDEVREVYLPLTRLLALHIEESERLYGAYRTFLLPGTEPPQRTPFVIGIAGSVSVGTSTIARLLRRLLALLPHGPRVELITTDGFLRPNAELERHGLMARKGFPESYDRR